MNPARTPWVDCSYEDLLADVLHHGEQRDDRTGTGTYSMFGTRLEYDLAKGFPLITSKKVHFKSVVGELLWFLSGSSNANELREKYGVTIWDEWGADSDGELGPVYGKQWRSWRDCCGGDIDQIARLITSLREDPTSRRHIVSAWNVADLNAMALAPCHLLMQWYVDGFNTLSVQVYQRSADMFLGVPFNIASYALLVHLVAAQTGLRPGKVIWVGGDTHVYRNHRKQVQEQLKRAPLHPFPKIQLAPADSIDDYTPEHITLLDYQSWPAIKAPVAV